VPCREGEPIPGGGSGFSLGASSLQVLRAGGRPKRRVEALRVGLKGGSREARSAAWLCSPLLRGSAGRDERPTAASADLYSISSSAALAERWKKSPSDNFSGRIIKTKL